MRAGLGGISRFSLVLIAALAACEAPVEDDVASVPSQLEAQSPACDFRGVAQNARGFFPGNGNSPPLATILDNVDLMEAACDASDREAYTDLWYANASVIQQVLVAGTQEDAADGDAFLDQTTAMLAPDEATLMFDPCGDAPAETCLPWEGYPATLPDWLSVLSDARGMWAVLTTGSAAQCSGFVYPCVDASPFDGEEVGVEPSPNWESVFGGLTTLQIGHQIAAPSPTGEEAAGADIQAYSLLLIPERTPFVAGELRVGLCSPVTTSVEELAVQKGQNGTILNEVSISGWCDTDAVMEASLLQRLGSFLSPVPGQLHASAFLANGPGMGGRAGGYTDFYFVDILAAAVQELLNQPVTGTVGQPIVDAAGQPLQISTYTTSGPSPVENVEIVATVVGNGGLIPSGNIVSADNLSCTEKTCVGYTGADEDPTPGVLTLQNFVITKPGSYSLCFEATLAPLVFNNPVCTDKFVMNP